MKNKKISKVQADKKARANARKKARAKARRRNKSRAIAKSKREGYVPDLDCKALFKGLSSKKLLAVLTYLFSIEFLPDTEFEFVDTESSTLTGSEDKGFVRSDLVLKIWQTDNKKDAKKMIIEFQSTKDKSMGYRLFIYSLNHSKMVEIDGVMYYEPAMCMTIYTELNKPLHGVDVVKVKQYKYEYVDFLKYRLIDTDSYYEVEYPFINILAMTKDDLDKLDKKEIDIFKLLYLYRYKKQHNLLLEEDFFDILDKAYKMVDKYNGKDLTVLSDILIKLIKDIKDILNTEKKKVKEYGEVLDVMQTTKSYPELDLVNKIRREAFAEGKAECKAEIFAECKAEIFAECKAEIFAGAEISFVSKLIKYHSDEEIFQRYEVPLDRIREIRSMSEQL